MYSGVPQTCEHASDEVQHFPKLHLEISIGLAGRIYLFVQELSCVLLNMPLIKVGGQAHQPNLGKPKICELDVSH